MDSIQPALSLVTCISVTVACATRQKRMPRKVITVRLLRAWGMLSTIGPMHHSTGSVTAERLTDGSVRVVATGDWSDDQWDEAVSPVLPLSDFIDFDNVDYSVTEEGEVWLIRP